MRSLHVYLASNQWDDLWIVQQPICFEIQREQPVLYVERFVSLFTVLRYPRLWRRLFTWLRGARRVTKNLHLLAPLPLFHLGHRLPWLFRLEFSIQGWWIRRWMRSMRHDEVLLWVDSPLYECAVRRLNERVSIYHVADEMSAFPTSDKRQMSRLEERLLAKVDLVFAAAEQLARDKARSHARTYTIWNAISTEAFSGAAAERDTAAVSAIRAPRIAFVGMIDDWVDLRLMAEAARALPDMSFIIIGDSRVDDTPLRGLPNVVRLGRRPRTSVPGMLGLCAVSIVPFKRTPLTERILPLKVFEALAAGIMPICTDFSADLEHLAEQGFTLVAKSDADFTTMIRRAVAEDTPARRTRFQEFGRAQTWSQRWTEMRTIIGRGVSRE
jgi:glycosyltransferase involved in cell wall biosynthesis